MGVKMFVSDRSFANKGFNFDIVILKSTNSHLSLCFVYKNWQFNLCIELHSITAVISNYNNYILFTFRNWNVLGGFHGDPFSSWGNPARLVSQLLILLGISDCVEKERKARPHVELGRVRHAKRAGVSPYAIFNVL